MTLVIRQTLSSAALTVVALFGATVPALAQSAYGCSGLDSAPVPTVEGTGGVFFRIDPDLMTYHLLSDQVIGQIGDLSRILAERGTTLVVVPIPSKALVLDNLLGPETAKRGYDPDLAAAIHADTLARLKSSGVHFVNARDALQAVEAPELPFFRADPRLTNPGLFTLARATASRIVDGVNTLQPTPAGQVTLTSPDRLALQSRCLLPLPDVTTADLSLDVADTPPRRIVVAGTDLTGQAELGFATYLSAFTGMGVERLSVPGDSIAALSAVLTQRGFARDRPDFLVWELPLWQNPALFGDQPMRELLAAAQDYCGLPMQIEARETGRFLASLPHLDRPRDQSLLVDTGAQDVTAIEAHFTAPDGRVRSRSVIRSDGQPLTGRFFLPLSGLWPDGAQTVEIVTTPARETQITFALCRG